MNIKSCIAQATLCSALVFGISTASQAQTYTKEQLQQAYASQLTNEGYKPEITPGGNLRFRREGRFYVIYVDEKDPPFLNLSLSFTANDKSPQARLRRVEAANFANGQTKVAKAYVDSESDPIFAAESFLAAPGDLEKHLPRMLRAIDSLYRNYDKKFSE